MQENTPPMVGTRFRIRGTIPEETKFANSIIWFRSNSAAPMEWATYGQSAGLTALRWPTATSRSRIA